MPEQKGERLCPICDSPLQPGSKKCGFCGTDLTLFEAEPEPETPKPEAPVAEVAAETPAPAQEQEPEMDTKLEEVFFGPTGEEPAQDEPAQETEAPAVEQPSVAEPEPEPEPQPEAEAEVAEAPAAQPAPAVEEAVVAEAKEETVEPTEVAEVFECPQCGSHVLATANTCDNCGAMFADEAADMFECPACQALVSMDAKACPGCGAIFVDSEEEKAAASEPQEAAPERSVEPERELEPQVYAVPEEPIAEEEAKVAPAEGESVTKKLLGGLFGKRKKKEREPEPYSDSVLRDRESFAGAPAARAEVERPVQTFVEPERKAPTPAPVDASRDKSKGKELARLTAEIQPLMHLAISRGVDVAESRKLVDAGAVSVRARQLDTAVKNVMEAHELLTARLKEHIEQLKADLNEEAKVAKELGGDISRTRTYLEQLHKADAASDFEAVYVYSDKVKNELMPITGRYNESKQKIAALKGLLADSELLSANTREARQMLTEAMKSFEANEFDKVDATIKDATKRLYQEIDPRMEDEIRKARNQLVELKAKGMNITPLITILKSARTLMLSKDYAQALKELREFKEQVKKAE